MTSKQRWQRAYQICRLRFGTRLSRQETAAIAISVFCRRKRRMSNRAAMQNSIARMRRMGAKSKARDWLEMLLEASRIWNKFKLY